MLDDDDASGWLPSDLPEIWQHQLTASLALELSRLEPGQAGVDPSNMPANVAELFSQESPSLSLLKLVKKLAVVRRTQGTYPPEIATVLYYAAVAVALTRCQVMITELSAEKIFRSLHWASCLHWVDQVTRDAIEASLLKLSQS